MYCCDLKSLHYDHSQLELLGAIYMRGIEGPGPSVEHAMQATSWQGDISSGEQSIAIRAYEYVACSGRDFADKRRKS